MRFWFLNSSVSWWMMWMRVFISQNHPERLQMQTTVLKALTFLKLRYFNRRKKHIWEEMNFMYGVPYEVLVLVCQNSFEGISKLVIKRFNMLARWGSDFWMVLLPIWKHDFRRKNKKIIQPFFWWWSNVKYAWVCTLNIAAMLLTSALKIIKQLLSIFRGFSKYFIISLHILPLVWVLSLFTIDVA